MNHLEQRLREDLAACYRLVAHYRMSDLIFTHLSVRIPGPEHHFLINPYGLLFEEITASNLVKIDMQGQPVDAHSQRVNPAGFVIHSAIHAAREDAQCVLHTHTRAGCAVACQPEGLLPLNQFALTFHKRIGYHTYEGVALDLDEQARLVADLADNDVMILRNHGLLTVGRSVAEAFIRLFYLEKACEVQIAAQAGGALILPERAVCERTRAQLNEPNRQRSTRELDNTDGIELAWRALLRQLERIAPDYRQ
ncbi:class II aldolase/adducin family protein [Pseudomonas nabeulensis]|uniref:Class II aldolase/adducin family protein n=1 Tax=Pseudomonas nabeulensis TaxID=2293833 RepID=A0A4Z0B5T7_9PSED|nr:class II aldolase/adducin family protein [Pseudomonas nabeulensis]TFY93644.1 class II aldolase/adducin family protein [Pseudomonas nabeulensis]